MMFFHRFLLAKFQAHINVEVIGSVGAIKYLFKYITKGQDKVRLSLQQHKSLLYGVLTLVLYSGHGRQVGTSR